MTTSSPTDLETKVRALAANASDEVLVEVLEKVETLEDQGVPADTVAVYRRLLIEAVEQRIDGVEDAVNGWFEAMPWDQGVSQEDYAAAVARFARERLAG